ncbi:MAG: sigma-54 dependent transcriptional regulator [Nitrospiraceae bacterium]|nr:sigma-54 dependent transcriptional regulator [Nitrospiraceae bacterium]
MIISRDRENVNKASILLVDDEPNALKVLSAIFSGDGYKVFSSTDGAKAMDIMDGQGIDAVITDLRMPGRDGMELFDFVLERHPGTPVIFLTAHGTVESAVEALTRGAFYYFVKPPDFLKLKKMLERAIGHRRSRRELEGLKTGPGCQRRINLTGGTDGMLRVAEIIESVRDSTSSVLISGETGTGKELAARALHYGGARRDLPFVAVNCAAIPGELIESELFGYEKGAFTGAYSRRIGRFEEAGAGTLFLDEIGELAHPLQSKLLRVLEERDMQRIGGSRRIKTNFRLVCSTNRDLQAEVQRGNFRQDLFYRVNVVHIKMPPLRDRIEDLPLLAAEFLNEYCLREDKKLLIPADMMETLQRYSWPGNVRQLRNVIERAVVLAPGGAITAGQLPSEILYFKRRRGLADTLKTLKELETMAVKKALTQCRGNKSKAAKALGISRKSFYKKLGGAF